jgi:hypothetical protein
MQKLSCGIFRLFDGKVETTVIEDEFPNPMAVNFSLKEFNSPDLLL